MHFAILLFKGFYKNAETPFHTSIGEEPLLANKKTYPKNANGLRHMEYHCVQGQASEFLRMKEREGNAILEFNFHGKNEP
jgi:hypothetical protein